jgi:glycosyltransferase involved in cell wall biosynthesis
MKKQNDLVSVVIVTKNEEKHIQQCLESVLGTAYQPKEVILVDDSSDSTPKIAASFKEVRIIRTIGSLGYARNVGWRAARGRFICFVDADILLPKDYFERMLPHFKGNVGIVGTRNKALRRGFFSDSDDLALHLSKIQWIAERGEPRSVPCGGTIYLRKVFLDAGGFDDVMFGEDSRLCLKARKKGYKIAYALDIHNYHDFTTDFKQWKRQCMKGGAGGANKLYLISLILSPFRGIIFMIQGLVFTNERKTSLYLPVYYPMKWIFICWGTFKERVLKRQVKWRQ